jgi:quercetin dioxygenase-like cupin family protein
MNGKFIRRENVVIEELDWGTLSWVSTPKGNGAKEITFIEVMLNPGKGHNFHKHPDQEELIMVKEGQVEQWLEDQKTILNPGESVFIPADVVHASFNVSEKPAQLMVVLGPCVGEGGYEVVEVADQEPWRSLR